MKRSLDIAVLGASGNVGRLVVRALLREDAAVVSRVLTINRRAIDDLFGDDPRLQHHIVDMTSGAALAEGCVGVLDGFDCVVATMGLGSGKGSVERFHKVEVELPSAFARAAANAGVRRAHLLTASGTDIENTFSWITPHVARGQYFHIKGLVERNFVNAGFANGVVAYRPAGLLGTDHLPAFVDRVLPLLDLVTPAHWHCIHIEQLAAAIARGVIEPGEAGFTVRQGETLFELIPGDRTRPADPT